MNPFDERIRKLQAQMARDGIQAYVIPATDPHLSEAYAPRYGAMRFYFCAFEGEDGTLLVTRKKAYLFTDGRYWTEALGELKGTSCELVKAGAPGVPSLPEFVREKGLYPLGLDASLFSLRGLKEFYVDEAHPIVSLDYSGLVENLPSLPKDPIWKVDPSLFSDSRKERVEKILALARKAGAEDVLMTALDDIAYTLGYRGNDILCTPVFYSYLYVNQDGTLDLFIDSGKLPEGFQEPDIRVHPYESVYSFLDGKKERKISVDLEKTNALLYRHVHCPVSQKDPAYVLKAVKGPVEIENERKVQIRDGLKVLKLQKFIDDEIGKGNLDEYVCAQYLDHLRLSDPQCFELSFPTIASVDANAAMMHYAPSERKHAPLTRDSQLLLVDSGGHYYGGTTDITRTFLVHEHPDPRIVRDYTLTLKSHIALARTVFEQGCNGHSLDLAAREVFWKEGLDYKCGTGHGVGYMLCVHEGPIGFRYYVRPGVDDSDLLQPGNLITDEPGAYRDGEWGIRLENELLVVPHPFKTPAQGIFYGLEPFSFVPFDYRGIDVSMLSDEELQWLNDYHGLVYDLLSPLAKEDEDKDLLSYLARFTAPLKR